MRKFIIGFLVFTLMGCGGMLCQKMSVSDVVKVQTTLQTIQGYYEPLKGLVEIAPVAGPILSVAIPLAMQATDSTLKALGQMLATNCVDPTVIALAQGTITQLEKVFAQPETQKAMRKYQIKAPK